MRILEKKLNLQRHAINPKRKTRGCIYEKQVKHSQLQNNSDDNCLNKIWRFSFEPTWSGGSTHCQPFVDLAASENVFGHG